MRAAYGENLRRYLGEKTNPKILLDFSGQKLFGEATVDCNILVFEKSINQGQTIACQVKEDCFDNLSVYITQNGSTNRFISSESWTILSSIEVNIKQKIEAIGVPLKDWNINIYRGILTGCNEAFVISREKKDELVQEDPKSAEIIRPILRGRDIKRYGFDYADLWLIATFPSKHYEINNFPAVRDYLRSFGVERLEQTGKKYIVNGQEIHARKKTGNKWFETQDSINYWNDFSKQKIIWGELSDNPKFAFDQDGKYTPLNTVFFMVGDDLEYLLAFLNSPISKYYFSKNIATSSGAGTIRWLKYTIETLPIPKPNPNCKEKIMQLINKIGSKSSSNITNEIDQMVFSLYGLSNDEIKYIMEYCHLL